MTLIDIKHHSALPGLSLDTHLQYLPRNGLRSMTGNLNMGTKSITNINTVNATGRGTFGELQVDSINIDGVTISGPTVLLLTDDKSGVSSGRVDIGTGSTDDNSKSGSINLFTGPSPGTNGDTGSISLFTGVAEDNSGDILIGTGLARDVSSTGTIQFFIGFQPALVINENKDFNFQSGNLTTGGNVTLGGDLSVAGSIGVGITPLQPLHVKGVADRNIRLEETSGSEYWEIGLDSRGDLNFWRDSGAIGFSCNDFDGFFGIGVENPTAVLHLEGDNNVSFLKIRTTATWLELIPYADDGIHWANNVLSGSSNGNTIFTHWGNRFSNHDHDTLSDGPTIIVHSILDPDISNNQWGSFHHDQSDFIITTGVATGTGSGATTDRNAIVLKGTGGTIFGVDGGVTDYTQISATGSITQAGTATATLLQLQVINNVGFYGKTPVTQNQLQTGAGKTVDDVITELQRLGLVKQAA